MIPLPTSTFGMNVKGEVLLQLLNKSKLSNGTKTFLELKFSHLQSNLRNFGFTAPLTLSR